MVWGGGFLGTGENGIAGLLFDGETLPIDYAGGTVVHINAGVAGLVLAVMLGKRLAFGAEPMRPHNLTLTMLGAGLLWFGWYGFNVGSIVFAGESPASDATQFLDETSLVWFNTTIATCAAILGWLLIEKVRDRRATSLKYRFGYDDSLDVVGVHLVGGLVGTIGAGLLATSTGLLYGGGFTQLVIQVLVALGAMVWSAVATFVVAVVVKFVIGLRVEEDVEVAGIDATEHGESAYDLTGAGGRAAAVRWHPAPVSWMAPCMTASTGKGRMHEARHRGHQAAQVGRRAGGTGDLWCDRNDGQRGQRLRPAEGTHRGVPRRRVRHRAGPQDPHRDRGRRRRC
jgi:Amt family ammonium transporter